MTEKNTPTIPSHYRTIKSFVLRQGKITLGQKNALKALAPKYCIPYSSTFIKLQDYFENDNDVILEIGSGMGFTTLAIAKANPHLNYVAIEVHGPGVGSLLMQIRDNNITNLKIIHYDANIVLKQMIPDASIVGVHIFFPDPWLKKRHHKRRIIQVPFIQLLNLKLKNNGFLHLATDIEEYAIWMQDILKLNPSFNLSDKHKRPLTKFEQRGIDEGRQIFDLYYLKEKYNF